MVTEIAICVWKPFNRLSLWILYLQSLFLLVSDRLRCSSSLIYLIIKVLTVGQYQLQLQFSYSKEPNIKDYLQQQIITPRKILTVCLYYSHEILVVLLKDSGPIYDSQHSDNLQLAEYS